MSARGAWNAAMARGTQWAFGLLGLGAVAWAITDDRFRDAEGYLLGTVCLPLAAGPALVFAAWAWTRPSRIAALLAGLALVGQAAALQVIDAGPGMHYQHYRPVTWMLGEARLPLAILVMQSVIVIAGFWKRRLVIRDWLAARFTGWRLAALAAGFTLVSATVSRDTAFYVQEIGLAAWVQLASLGTVVLAAIALPDRSLEAASRLVRHRWAWAVRPERGMDRLVVAAAVAVTLLAALLSLTSYQRHPHLGDEVAYVYQARYLATGALAMPLPPVLEAFTLDLFDYDAARWYASPPPGWPLVLALGVLAGVPWLVNPILAGACVLLTWALVSEVTDRRTGRIAALLLAVSPWHVLVGMSFMTHSASLAFALLAAFGVARARRDGNAWWALAAGLATGMVGMIRPLEGMVVGGLLGLWVIGAGGTRLRLLPMLAWGLGCLAVGVAIGAYNQALTGDLATFPIMAWADRFMGAGTNSLGFGPDRGSGWELDPFPGHGLRDVVVNANLNLTTINTELFGWGAGSLTLLLAGFLRRPWRRGDALMLVAAGAVVVAHAFYWFSGGPDFAARYWYLMIVPLVALTASAITALDAAPGTPSGGPTNSRTRTVVGTLSVMAFLSFLPWRAIDKYHHYLGMRPDALALASRHQMGRSLVLVRGDHSPDFASAATYNPIDLAGADAPVFAWDSGWELRAELLPRYADRPVWIVEGPSLTGAGYRVAEGPLSVESVLARDRESRATNRWNPPYAERLPESTRSAYTRPRIPRTARAR